MSPFRFLYDTSAYSVAVSYLGVVEFFVLPVCRIDEQHASVSSHRTLCCDSSPSLASSYTQQSTQHTQHSTAQHSTQMTCKYWLDSMLGDERCDVVEYISSFMRHTHNVDCIEGCRMYKVKM